MGLYDRDYYRTERPTLAFRPPTRMVGILIGVNVAVLLITFLLTPDRAGGVRLQSPVYTLFAVSNQTLFRPWLWYQFLTYGFVHAEQVFHILGNMLMLWIFGGDLEERYGGWEFLRFYLLCLVFGGVSWAAINSLQGNPPALMFGASGAVAGAVVLFAQNFPRRTIFAMLVIPIPAWLFGVVLVVGDMLGATGGQRGSNVAYSVHLAGAAFALLYYQLGWNFGRLFDWDLSWLRFRRRPRLRVLRPEFDAEDDHVSEDEVDRILEKLYREGESSLTSRERKTLQEASREYQRKRHGQ